MPPPLRIILIVLITGAWFLLGESREVGSKLGTLLMFVFFYVGFRLLTGVPLDHVFDPLLIP